MTVSKKDAVMAFQERINIRKIHPTSKSRKLFTPLSWKKYTDTTISANQTTNCSANTDS